MAVKVEYKPSNVLDVYNKNVDRVSHNLDVRIPEALRQDNYYRAVNGLDRNGVPLQPLKNPSDPRRPGSGPPLAPRGASSRIVTAFEVDVLGEPGHRTYVAGWNSSADFLKYHVSGTRYLPVRDVAGITPLGREEIRAIVRDELSQIGKK